MISPSQPIDPLTDLVLERIVPLSSEKIWKAWTSPDLLTHWFAPHPWTAHEAEVDLRPGGAFRVVMNSPEGQPMPCEGCYLEIVEYERLVWTDALTAGYRPSAHPFFTAVLTLSPHEAGTSYRVIARHRDAEVRRQHEEMGFGPGWNRCLDQLIALMQQG
jgi:uncharacterized protein YndB with AHSA1/START domain